MDDVMSSYDTSFTYTDDNSTSAPSSDHPLALGATVTMLVLSCAGVVGNLCLMHAVLRYKHMRTVPNILIFNLAVADLLYVVITTPLYVEHEFSSSFSLSLALCKFQHGVAFMAQYASAMALAALSRERYTAIACGMEARQRGGSDSSACADSSKGAVACVWIGACLLAMPTFFFAHMPLETLCTYAPAEATTKRLYDCLRFLVGYVIPLTVVAYFYLKLAVTLVRSSQRLHNECVTEAMVYQTKVRKRLALAVLIITAFFAVCWFPHFYYYLLVSFNDDPKIMGGPFPAAIDIYRYVGLLGPVINTCLDPWLLFVISSRHRACLLRCVSFRPGRQSTSPSSHSGVRMVTFRRPKYSAGAGTSISRLSRV